MPGLAISGRILRDGALERATVRIDSESGTIRDVATGSKAGGKGLEHTDLGDQVLLPGALDVHVHLREPGLEHKEDWRTGTTAAAFGGVTAVVDMPNTIPATTNAKTARDKLQRAAEKSLVDYGIWGGATWYTQGLEELLACSVGMKVFLGATTGDLLLEDRDAFVALLDTCGRVGKPVILHCESQRVLEQSRRTEKDLDDHARSRPPLAEVEAVYDIMKALAGVKQKPRIHVAHVASPDAVRAARSAGFSIGVCPHHLLLDTGMQFVPESHAKMNPPLRGAQNRQALWQAFAAGQIPLVESDHAPHTPAEKQAPFHQAPAGVPGVETMLPMLLARAATGDVTLGRVVEAACHAPARLLGLDDRGRLAAGCRADVVAVDLDRVEPVQGDALHSKCRWSPFEGHEAIWPSHVWSGGRAVVADGELVGKPGQARPLVE